MIFTGCQFIIDLAAKPGCHLLIRLLLCVQPHFNGGDHGEILMISKFLVVGDVEDEDEGEDDVGIEQD